MDEIKSALLQRAQNRFGKIHPCACKDSLEDCFTEIAGGRIALWFNTSDKSTHIVHTGEVAASDSEKKDDSQKICQ